MQHVLNWCTSPGTGTVLWPYHATATAPASAAFSYEVVAMNTRRWQATNVAFESPGLAIAPQWPQRRRFWGR
eukprot:159820-Chlamydomonas_euryale.AAC.3